ncbi:MAG: mycobactin polyketide synthase MbtD [Actinomycetota bacterium]|nr:mycobactin polyketide synthase MbtD [Actinomycetota bacterium]
MSRLPDGRVPVLLSAHDEQLLAADARAVLGYLDRTRPDVTEVAAQVNATRRLRRHRVALRAADPAELTAGLRAVASGQEHPLIARSSRREATRTAFVFPGQGGQWPAMGAESYRTLPVYRAEADRLDAALQAGGMPSALPFLTADVQTVSQAELHGAQFIHAVALAAVWRSCGLLPDLTIGHSLGEVAAAYVAEAITLSDAVAVLGARARAIAAIPGSHGVAVLGVDAAGAEELIAGTAGWLELSAVNATRSVAVAGESTAVAAVVETARRRGLFARELAMSFPAHTSAMDDQRDELMRALPAAVTADAAVQFIGSATGAVVPAGTEFGPYWYANLRNTIRFDLAVRAAIGRGAGAFLEMSAHPALLFAVQDGLESSAQPGDAVLVGSGHRDHPVPDTLAANIVAAAVADPRYRWADLLTAEPRRLRRFPGAPMRADQFWAGPEPLPPVARMTVAGETWRAQPAPAVAQGADRRVALLDLGGSESHTQRLLDTLIHHDGAVLADYADAEVLVVVAPRGADGDEAAAITDLAHRVDSGLLDYAGLIGPRCREIWLLTTGAETVGAHDRADPVQAALAAMHRSIGFEHPDQSFHHLDLPAGATTADTSAAAAILTGAGELALREGTVYRRTLGEGTAPAEPWRLDSGLLDEVVITGGSGVIGLGYARYLAAHGARRITLLSRRGVDPAVVAELRGLGAVVEAPVCDLTDSDQLAAAAADGGAATLVVHAAGTASFAERTAVTGDALAEMCAAKIIGLDRLVRRWPLRDDTRILLCSSVIGVWGGKGTAGYAAANRMLDVAAARYRAQGLRCSSVRWGLWAGGGIVDAGEIARVERAGLRQMDPARAVEASLAEHPGDPLILLADPDRLRMFFDTGAEPADPTPADEAATGPDRDGAPLAAPDAVRSQLAVVLNAEATTLDLDATLFDLGVDSLLALDLRKRLKRLTGHTVPLATLLGGITGTDLIAAITESGHSA